MRIKLHLFFFRLRKLGKTITFFLVNVQLDESVLKRGHLQTSVRAHERMTVTFRRRRPNDEEQNTRHSSGVQKTDTSKRTSYSAGEIVRTNFANQHVEPVLEESWELSGQYALARLLNFDSSRKSMLLTHQDGKNTPSGIATLTTDSRTSVLFLRQEYQLASVDNAAICDRLQYVHLPALYRDNEYHVHCYY